MSSDKALMQEIWRQGFTRPDGITIKGRNPANAAKLRFALYNAVKQFRDGRGEPDEVLGKAIESCSVVLVHDGSDVRVQHKLTTDLSRDIIEQLGEAPKTVEDHKMLESMERLMSKVNAVLPTEQPTVPVVNPGSKYGARG